MSDLRPLSDRDPAAFTALIERLAAEWVAASPGAFNWPYDRFPVRASDLTAEQLAEWRTALGVAA